MLASKNKYGILANIKYVFLALKIIIKCRKIDNTIVFFGSAKTKPEDKYYQIASNLAFKLGEWSKDQPKKYAIATGGGPGIMEAGNKGAKKAKVPSLGFCIDLPFENGANPYVNKNLKIIFPCLFLRKFWHLLKASAIIVFPGGFGTLDELFEILTMFKLKEMENIPLVLFGKEFWEKLVNWQMLVDEGMIDKDYRENIIFFSNDVDETFEHVRDGLICNFDSGKKNIIMKSRQS